MASADRARQLTGSSADYDSLLERAATSRFVLIGEASHGTHEFYRERAEITKRLIAEAGVTAVMAEADWPDAYRVNLFVRGESEDASAEEALRDFRRFPAWMWRNTDVVDFVAWLREWNDALPDGAARTGFYGLDLYSLHASMEAVVRYLEEVDPEAARRARERYSCFDHFGPDPQVYAYEAGVGGAEPCEQEAVEQLVDALVGHLQRTRGGRVKAAVWAHNSHVGDARRTQMRRAGELNIGQLVRERHGGEALLVGFTTYSGTVTAASDWGGPAERKRVRRALEGSWEELFHRTGVPRFLLAPAGPEGQRLERAIGVIYRPQTERLSHYFEARLAEQFDAVIHVDETRAVEPLEPTSEWEAGELPETYPWAV